MFDKNNAKIILNVLYVKIMNIYPVYISKHKLNMKKKFIILMTPYGEGRLNIGV